MKQKKKIKKQKILKWKMQVKYVLKSMSLNVDWGQIVVGEDCVTPKTYCLRPNSQDLSDSFLRHSVFYVVSNSENDLSYQKNINQEN